MSPGELHTLEWVRQTVGDALESRGSDLQKIVGTIITWELRRYSVEDSAYPSVGLAQRVMNPTGIEVLAGFKVQEGSKPFIVISLTHPEVRKDAAQLLMSIFHEVHHFLNWRKDPLAYAREKDLPGTDPIEVEHEETALQDLHACLKQIAETGSLNR